MTREELLERLEWVIEYFNASSMYLWPDEKEKLLKAITALRGPVPDPSTGLVPCGCGGRAEFCGSSGDNDWVSVGCTVCDTDSASYATKEEARVAWNKAMGGQA